jgi:hypothetical protein
VFIYEYTIKPLAWGCMKASTAPPAPVSLTLKEA